MQRILILTIILTLLAFPVVAQEQKPLTPEQIAEVALEGMLNWKIKYGKETIFAAEMQALALSLEKTVKALNEKLKQANTKIAQLEMDPVPYDQLLESVDVPEVKPNETKE